jgi:hypothetical protein
MHSRWPREAEWELLSMERHVLLLLRLGPEGIAILTSWHGTCWMSIETTHTGGRPDGVTSWMLEAITSNMLHLVVIIILHLRNIQS